MKVNLRVKDMELGRLNTECLVLTSKFARALKHHNGKELKMQHPSVLGMISDCARKTRSEELKEIYSELRAEIIMSMYNSKYRKD